MTINKMDQDDDKLSHNNVIIFIYEYKEWDDKITHKPVEIVVRLSI